MQYYKAFYYSKLSSMGEKPRANRHADQGAA